jgi:hypothetical protein
MKFVTIDKGRPNLAVIPNDCPQKVIIYFLSFIRKLIFFNNKKVKRFNDGLLG